MEELQKVQKQGVRVHALENFPVLKTHLEEVWGFFCWVSSRRTSNGFAVSRIQDRQVLDAFEIHGIRDSHVRAWYVDLVDELDTVLMTHLQKKEKTDGQNRSRN